jgi:hypothetical protein
MISPSERERAFGHNEHVRIYAADFRERLEQVGFELDVFEWVTERDTFGGSRNRFGLIEDEALYFAVKP